MNIAKEPSYDRVAELKAFDDSKAGVKGLVDAGITKLPPFFIHPNASFSIPCKPDVTIPVIDLSGIENDPKKRKKVVESIRAASGTWGFFQVVNHGVPVAVLEEMLEGVRRFFEQDVEVKKKYYSRDYVNNKVLYNSNYNLYTEASAKWRDTMFCRMTPDPPTPEELPSACRDILVEFSREVMGLGNLLMELFSEALGLKPSHLKDMDCCEGLSVISHYSPACPQPEIAMATPRHADDDFFTVLLQNHIGGLQVLHDDHWIDIPPVPGALVINIGDLLQLVSNDKFKSIEHRVLANRKGPRLSVACFFSTMFQPSPKLFGPIKELLSEDNPPKYREVTQAEFAAYANSKGLNGVSSLLKFRL